MAYSFEHTSPIVAVFEAGTNFTKPEDYAQCALHTHGLMYLHVLHEYGGTTNYILKEVIPGMCMLTIVSAA